MQKSIATGSLLVVLGFGGTFVFASESCPPNRYSREQLVELKQHDFVIADDRQLNALAVALIPCLADRDPTLRDGIAFEALATWMRGGRVTTATATTVMQLLLPRLTAEQPDPIGVARPFAVLALAEVARMDRIATFMSSAQRDQLLSAATSYLVANRDYRGFDAEVGWRHGVAHGADLLMQLALHPKSTKLELDSILSALATQVAPAGEHFYVYGEGDRLARPVFLIAQRGRHSADEWRQWIAKTTSPAPLAKWADAFQSQSGLAKRHNTLAFLNALYVQVRESDDEKVEALLVSAVGTALSQLR